MLAHYDPTRLAILVAPQRIEATAPQLLSYRNPHLQNCLVMSTTLPMAARCRSIPLFSLDNHDAQDGV